jgi:stage II sporulation protein M
MKKRLYQSVAANHIRENSSVYIFVIVLFLIGVIFGAVVVNSLSFSQKEDLFYYLTQFFGQLTTGKETGENDLFMQSLLHNSKYIGLMWLLGISIIGLPVILIMLFIKGMVVGFTVGFLVNQMAWDGFLLSFVSVLPQNVIIIPTFIFMTVITVNFSLQMIKRQFMKKISSPFLPMLIRYFLTLIAAVICLSLAAALEAYLSPPLMKAVLGML